MKPNRRQFLKASLLSLAAIPGLSVAQATPPAAAAVPRGLPADWRAMRKFDVHGHISGVPAGRMWRTPAELIEACDALGIERICCSIPVLGGELATVKAVRASNDAVLAAMRSFPGRILGLCFVQPGHGPAALDEIDRCLDAGMVGVKLYNQYKFSDPLLFPVAEKCIARAVPFLGHSSHMTGPEQRATQPNSSTGEDFCALAARYPELMLIMAHVNGGGDWEMAIRMVRACPSVYLDTSGSNLDERTVDEAVRQLGAHRVLFGTDMTMEGGVGKILGATLTDAQREDIFWRNLHRIFEKRRV